MQTNKNYDNLEQSYLFSTIARKVREYSEAHPEADIIRLGIGDVTRPLVPAVIDALHAAVEDQAKQETFHGYGDEQGYGFLHEALVGYYKSHGVELATNEIFISDGAKSDLGNILDIFGTDNTVLVPDPVYPVYVDTNVMAGRKIVFADANEANGFLPLPDESVQCTVLSRLLSEDEKLFFSISATTRAPRPGEKDGVQYYFLTKEDFEAKIAANAFLEHAKYVDNYYGTLEAPVNEKLEAGYDVILEIEVQGAMQVHEKRPDAVMVFIAPPSFEELANRLRGRGTEDEAKVQKRLETAKGELAQQDKFDYVVVNDTVERAVEELHGILAKRR